MFPSSHDLLMAFPRLLQRAGLLAEHMDSVFGKMRHGGSVIAEPTISNATNATAAATSAGSFVQASLAVTARATGAVGQDATADVSPFTAIKNIGAFFNYMTSKWAIATFFTVCFPGIPPQILPPQEWAD